MTKFKIVCSVLIIGRFVHKNEKPSIFVTIWWPFCFPFRSSLFQISRRDISRGPAGVRAQAMNAAGELVSDFVFDLGNTFLEGKKSNRKVRRS